MDSAALLLIYIAQPDGSAYLEAELMSSRHTSAGYPFKTFDNPIGTSLVCPGCDRGTDCTAGTCAAGSCLANRDGDWPGDCAGPFLLSRPRGTLLAGQCCDAGWQPSARSSPSLGPGAGADVRALFPSASQRSGGTRPGGLGVPSSSVWLRGVRRMSPAVDVDHQNGTLLACAGCAIGGTWLRRSPNALLVLPHAICNPP